MARINNVTISHAGRTIATAPSGEIAPPPAPKLTVEGVTWIGYTGKPDGTDYLQKQVEITATAAGHPWNGSFTLSSIIGKTVKLN